ncbi:MAG: SbmA/BacA-like family transporter [Solirubrobacterales bacterium]
MARREERSLAWADIDGFRRLALGYWRSEGKWRVRGLTVLLLALTGAEVAIPVLSNTWSKMLFDALEQHSSGEFMDAVAFLVGIVAVNMAVIASHLRVKRSLQLGWRDWITDDVVGRWMDRGPSYRIAAEVEGQDNPDGRIAEDIRITTETAIELAHSFLYCTILLISFTNILWGLSGALPLALGETEIAIPGYLVFVALAYAALATCVALLVGRPLVEAMKGRQAREADFRFGLCHVRENAGTIALLRRERRERGRLRRLFGKVADAWAVQTEALTRVTMFTSSYTVLSTAVPLLAVSPRYLAGAISLGALIQTAQAFQQMASALSWPVDNLARCAEWRASMARVAALYQAMAMAGVPVAEEAEPAEAVGGLPALADRIAAAPARD